MCVNLSKANAQRCDMRDIEKKQRNKQKVQPEQMHIEEMLSLICGFAEKYFFNIHCGETGLRIVLMSP